MIDFSLSTDEIKQQILKQYASTLNTAKSELEKATQEMAKHEEAIGAMRSQYDNLRTRSTRYRTQRDKLKQEYLRLSSIYNKSLDKQNELDSRIRNSSTTRSGANAKRISLKERLGVVLEILQSEESISAFTSSLISLRKLIDTSHKVTIKPGHMQWVTCPIYIKDVTGYPIPQCFGQYVISLKLDDTNSLCAHYELVPGSDFTKIDGYSHPHVNTLGEPCLGNATEILTDALRSFNPVLAITTVNEHLTVYNTISPYIHLNSWVPSFHYSQKCECGLVPKENCKCPVCKICNLKVVHSDMLICESCKDQYLYFNQEVADKGLGINGSGYVYKDHNNRMCVYLNPSVLCTAQSVQDCSCTERRR